MNTTEADLRVAKELVVGIYGDDVDGSDDVLYNAIASALAAEREKAAKIAETEYQYGDDRLTAYQIAGNRIAASIRAGDTPVHNEEK